jgi:hypothetical protein
MSLEKQIKYIQDHPKIQDHDKEWMIEWLKEEELLSQLKPEVYQPVCNCKIPVGKYKVTRRLGLLRYLQDWGYRIDLMILKYVTHAKPDIKIYAHTSVPSWYQKGVADRKASKSLWWIKFWVWLRSFPV